MKKNKFLLVLVVLFSAVVMTGCSDDDGPGFQYSGTDTRYYVLSQGKFPDGEASVSAVKSNGTNINNLFSLVNGRPVGQVAQSMVKINGNYYITVSNSGKIEVVNPTYFSQVKTITNPDASFFSPYHICQIDNTTAVVSDVAMDNACVLDLSSGTITGSINVGATSQYMALAGGKLFFGCSKYDAITELNEASFRVMDVADLNDPATAVVEVIAGVTPPYGAGLFTDSSGKVWVLAEEGLVCVDPANTGAVAKTISYGSASLSWSSFLDMRGDYLYINAEDANFDMGVYKASVNDTELPATPMFTLPSDVSVYAMKVSPEGNVVVCDPLTYTESGYVYEFSAAGDQLNRFTVGVVPGFVYFK